MKRTIIRGAIMIMAMVVGAISATAGTFIVGSTADGALRYYNPFNNEQGSINNDGVVWDGGAAAGDTIGICAYGDGVYTFGKVTSGANAEQFRVNKIDLSGIFGDVSGDDIVASDPGNLNILTNSVVDTLVDFAYDGTDFWFLALDGKVYKNSSTTAEFSYGDSQVADYNTISLWGPAGLVAGASIGTTGSRIMGFDAGTGVQWLHQYDDGASARGDTFASSSVGINMVSYIRIDNLAYNGVAIDDNYAGNVGDYNGVTPLGCAQGFYQGNRGLYTVNSAGGFNFQQVALGNFVDTIGIVAAEVSDPPPQPFPELENSTGSNLIPNGDLDTLANESPATPGAWNVAGTYGDYASATNRTADLVNWSPYYEDPNALIPAVGTPHVIDDNGELDGTFYLDTHINGDILVLNSVMDYRNGMKQENILNGVMIDPGATYEYRITVSHPYWDSLSPATFTAALTVGSGADVTNTATAVAGSFLEIDVNTIGSESQVLSINGADLIAAQSSGQVNVVLDHLNTTPIPGFPSSVSSSNVLNNALNSQIEIDAVSLAKVVPARVGDVNRDGYVFEDDVDLANSYLSGAIDFGDSAFVRQTTVIADGMSSNAALTYLNLTDFDLTGNDFFDAADVTAIEALVEAPPLQMNVNGGDLEFEWFGDESKRYDLLSTAALIAPDWTVYNDGATTYGNIAGTNTNTLTGVMANGAVNFFRLLEKPSGTSYIQVLDPSFENGITSGNWGSVNTVWNPSQPSGYRVNSIDHIDAHEGAWSILIQYLTIEQDLGTTVNAGDTITLIFSGGRGKATASTSAGGTFNGMITVNGESVSSLTADTTTLDNGAWENYTNTVTLTTTGALGIRFENTGATQPWLDDVRAVKREEP